MLRSPFMRAALMKGCGIALMASIPLLSQHLAQSSVVAILLGGVGGALMGAGAHASWWPLNVTQGSPEPMPVRGLSETIRDLAPRMGTPGIVGGRAVLPRQDWAMVTIVEDVELQVDHELMMEPWPWVRTLLATTMAGTAIHRRLRVPVMGVSAILGASLALYVVMSRQVGALATLMAVLIGVFPATAVGGSLFRRSVLRRKRQILLTESDVEDSPLWPLGQGY